MLKIHREMQRFFSLKSNHGLETKVCYFFVRLKPSHNCNVSPYFMTALSCLLTFKIFTSADCNACIWVDNFSNFPNSKPSRAQFNEKPRTVPANEDVPAKQSLSQLREELANSHLSPDRQNNLKINLRPTPTPTPTPFPVNNFQRRVDVQ